MNALTLALAAMATAVVLACASAAAAPLASAAADDELTMPATADEHTEEAAKYAREAIELEVKAERYARMARHYRARYTAGSKQGPVLLRFIEQSERRAQAYRAAALKARTMAQSR